MPIPSDRDEYASTLEELVSVTDKQIRASLSDTASPFTTELISTVMATAQRVDDGTKVEALIRSVGYYLSTICSR